MTLSLMVALASLLALCAIVHMPVASHQAPAANTETLGFSVAGQQLSGLLTTPASERVQALVVLVHGYGETRVVAQKWYYELRMHFAARGIASFTWDKPGCGQSEGRFDPDQSVQGSADEVVAAAAFLREQELPGSQKIGLWGVSRAGWIAPLALARTGSWLSGSPVSGVDAKESFGYLLQSNWRIEGYGEDRIEALYQQWLRGNQIVSAAGDYEDYLQATAELRRDPFMISMSGGQTEPSEQEYTQLVDKVRQLAQPIDPESGLAIYVEGFPELLASLEVPVLALLANATASSTGVRPVGCTSKPWVRTPRPDWTC